MLWFVAFGLVVGVIARLIVPGRQELHLGTTVLLGVIGAVAGGLVANAISDAGVLELSAVGAIVAVAVSVVLIVIGERTGALRRRFGRAEPRGRG